MAGHPGFVVLNINAGGQVSLGPLTGLYKLIPLRWSQLLIHLSLYLYVTLIHYVF